MMIEQKNISSLENLLFFTKPLSIIGSIHSNDTSNTPDIVKNIKTTNLATEFLLTSDFIYIKSNTPENLSDLTSITIAELDDLSISNQSILPNTENIEEKIKLILKIIIAPFLNKDGGDLEFVSYTNNTVAVKFLGKCSKCPYATRTLKERVEKNLIHYIPTIKEAVLV